MFYYLLRNRLYLNINFEDWIRISSDMILQQFHFRSWRWLQRVLTVIKPSLASNMEIYGEFKNQKGCCTPQTLFIFLMVCDTDTSEQETRLYTFSQFRIYEYMNLCCLLVFHLNRSFSFFIISSMCGLEWGFIYFVGT